MAEAPAPWQPIQATAPSIKRREDAHEVGTWIVIATIIILPLTRLIEIELVGTVFLHDILTFPILALLLLRPSSWSLLKPLRPCLVLIAIWLLGAVATDQFRQVAFNDLARGWSRILLLAGNITLIWVLCEGRLRRLSLYVMSLGITLILNPLINPSDLSETNPWKFGIGYGAALIMAAGIGFPAVRRLVPQAVALLGISIVAFVSLYLNARSAFAITLLSVAYAAFATFIGRHPRFAHNISPWVFIGVIVLGMLFSNLMLMLYGDLAAQGFLGAAAREKYFLQSGGGSVGLLLGGRPESLVSVQAIWDSPIIGHGSWATDPYYTHLFQAKLRTLGLVVPDDYREIGKMTGYLIPTHSHVLGSWVEAGILSLPFWGWAIFLSFSALYSAIRVHWQPNVLVSLISLSMLWDVLFSPFANDARIIKAAEICVLISAIGLLRTIPAGRQKKGAPTKPKPVTA